MHTFLKQCPQFVHNIQALYPMIYQRINNFPILKYIYTYLYFATAALQIIACLCLYPVFFPFFDGVNTFAYLFITMAIIMLILYSFEATITFCCTKQRTFVDHYSSIFSIFATLALLAGGIMYSPLVGHQEDREKMFILGEAEFFIIEGLKVWLLYNKHKKLNQGGFFDNKELLKSIFSCSSWMLQLVGTVMFVYSVYVQQIMVIGVFLYGTSSFFWAASVWIYTRNSNLPEGRPCNLKVKEPESSSLNELPQPSE